MSEPSTDPIAALAEEVGQLRDLFHRRLLEDRQRQQLYDELYRQLEFARTGMVGEYVAPIVRELLLVLDRIDALSEHVGSETAEVLGTVRVELFEVLARRGVRTVPAVGEAFDPAVHEAVERVHVSDPADDGVVRAEHRPGYLLDDRLLRPARVAVGATESTSDQR